jgi:hypothetical protein
LAPLPDAVPLYPGHGAGSPCGANICDRQSTLGHERRHNPALQLTDESALIDWSGVIAPLPRNGSISCLGSVNENWPKLSDSCHFGKATLRV